MMMNTEQIVSCYFCPEYSPAIGWARLEDDEGEMASFSVCFECAKSKGVSEDVIYQEVDVSNIR